jgi:hypothetical protein
MHAGIKISDEASNLNKAVLDHKLDWGLFEITKNEVIPSGHFPPEERKGKAQIDGDVIENFKANIFPTFEAVLIGSASPKYATIEFHYEHEGRPTDKIVSVYWCPNNAKVKDKMVSASTFQPFCQAVNAQKKLQATDASQITYAAVLAQILQI